MLLLIILFWVTETRMKRDLPIFHSQAWSVLFPVTTDYTAGSVLRLLFVILNVLSGMLGVTLNYTLL